MTSVITPPVGKVKRVNIILFYILQRVRSTFLTYSCSGRSWKVSGKIPGSLLVVTSKMDRKKVVIHGCYERLLACEVAPGRPLNAPH